MNTELLLERLADQQGDLREINNRILAATYFFAVFHIVQSAALGWIIYILLHR